MSQIATLPTPLLAPEQRCLLETATLTLRTWKQQRAIIRAIRVFLAKRFRERLITGIIATQSAWRGKQVRRNLFLVARRSVFFREISYDVQYDAGSLGIELDTTLRVKRLAPGGQSHKKGVRVGSDLVAVGGVPVRNVEQLAIAMKTFHDAKRPIVVKFSRQRRKKRKFWQQQQRMIQMAFGPSSNTITINNNTTSPIRDNELTRKEKRYLKWMYGVYGYVHIVVP